MADQSVRVHVRPSGRADEADWRRLWRNDLAFHQTELPEEVHATWNFKETTRELHGRAGQRPPFITCQRPA